MQVAFLGGADTVSKLPELQAGWHKVAPEDTFVACVFDLQAPLASLLSADSSLEICDRFTYRNVPVTVLRDGARYLVDLRGLLTSDANDVHSVDSGYIGVILSEVLEAKPSAVKLFLGLDRAADAGKGMLSALGVDIEAEPDELNRSLKELRTRLQNIEITVAATSALPFSGIDGLGPHLSQQMEAEEANVIMRQGTKWASRIENLFPAPVNLLGTPTVGPYRRQGSACGGGGAGALVALGARIFPIEDYLAAALPVQKLLSSADLVICQQEELDYLSLPTSMPATVAQVAQKYALPVLALAKSAPVTKFDLANVGIHGVIETDHINSALGERLATTWSHR